MEDTIANKAKYEIVNRRKKIKIKSDRVTDRFRKCVYVYMCACVRVYVYEPNH